VRLGFRHVKGLREDEMQVLVKARQTLYTHIDQLRSIGVSEAALEILADADAFRSLGADRRKALWEVSALGDRPVALFEGTPSESVKEAQIQLPLMTEGEHVVQDYSSTGLSLKNHPVALVREKLALLHNVKIADLKSLKDGDHVRVTGLITVRQRPGTAKGVLFMTLEDETGAANIVVWESLFDKYRKEIIQSRLFMVQGKLQVEGEVIHVVAQRCFNLNDLLRSLTQTKESSLPLLTLARADEITKPHHGGNKGEEQAAKQEQIFYKGRNFK
ncbi:MAG: error-prone DNA polymerase, partial [Sphingobacteriales bacterium]